jgi:hypothetical protein
MRMISYDIPADYTDEYLRIGEYTTLSATVCKGFDQCFLGLEYLWALNEEAVMW